VNWTVRLSRPAEKTIARAPAPDRVRLLAALDAMARDPKLGDTRGLQHPDLPAFRRGVGSYRILFDLYPEQRLVDIIDDITRRTTTTYRKR
jgi:mRNA-degrading endonuclease RelE of RelBE toxin-antitoxin system